MKKTLPALLFLFFLLLWGGMAQAQVDYFSPEKIYQFAEYLYKEGDFLRAAGEFERYLLLTEMSADNDSTLYKIGLCYRLGRNPLRAVEYFQRIVEKSLKDNATYQIAYAYFEMGDYDRSIQKIKENCPQPSDCNEKDGHLLVINYLHKKRWQEAHNISSSLVESRPDSSDSSSTILSRLTLEGTHLPRKSKVVAGIMSSLIPGSGKMYARRFGDGLYSLVIIGLTGWQAYEGFNRDGTRSARGWTYGTLSTVFYFGNVYGSVVAVKIHNQKAEDDFLSKVDISLWLGK